MPARAAALVTAPFALAAAAAALAVACGSSQEKPSQPTSTACSQADARLRKQLGPELQAVSKRIPVMKPAVGEAPPEALGCAIVYTLVAEELAEEGLGEETTVGNDHRIAFLTPDPKTRWNLTLVEPSGPSPGPVELEVELQDVTFDGVPEVVVRESALGAESYQGLRLFSLTVAPDGPRDLLSESLKLKTRENVELNAQWRAVNAGGTAGVIFEAGGASRIFGWSEADKQFKLDEAATAAANPPPPAPPSEAAPATAPPTEPPPPPPPPAKGKGAKGTKGAKDKKAAEPPAAPASNTPIELP